MDYTLSTFLPECSLSQEPKTRQEIEKRLNMSPSSTSMPLLMHIINAVKNGVAKAPQTNNFVSPIPTEPKNDKPLKEDMLWENKNMDIKSHLAEDTKKDKEKSPGNQNSNLSNLGELPPLTKKKGGLEPLNFNPKETKEEDKFSESVDKEKKSLDEVDKKLKEFENGMKMEIAKPSPDKKSHKFGGKNTKPKTDDFADYEDDFEDDIDEDLPVEDFDMNDHKDKNPEFTESGVSASQSYGMDPSVTSLDIEGYDHVEQAIINSPYKM